MLLDLIILAATGIGAMWACYERPGALSRTMAVAWAMSAVIYVLIATHLLKMSYVPGAYAMTDLVIALSCLSLWTHYHSQRARLVGFVSMLLLLVHFGFSALRGALDWGIYALLLNAGFMLQCYTAGGGLDGVVDFLDRVRQRNHHGNRAGNGG